MRRLMAIILSIGFLCTSAFLYAETVKKLEKAPQATRVPAAKRVTGMRAAGIVTEISDTTLKIERKIKDQAETMEFALEKPVAKIKAGDKVRVSYITKEDRNIATRVIEEVPQKVVKKVKPVKNRKVLIKKKIAIKKKIKQIKKSKKVLKKKIVKKIIKKKIVNKTVKKIIKKKVKKVVVKGFAPKKKT